MHPDVCAFVSERSYDGRLRSRDACAGAAVDRADGRSTGTGLRALAVEHEGRSQASPEEAEAIAAACRDLLAGATVTDDEGDDARRSSPTDIMVVAPYNLAVRCIREHVPDGRARRHGRPLPGPAGAGRLLRDDLLGRRGRAARPRLPLRRATASTSRSRARSASPCSSTARACSTPTATTLEAMALVDGACRFVEMATPAAKRRALRPAA